MSFWAKSTKICAMICVAGRKRERERESKARLIFSLPNMQKWLSNKFTNTLNYEHTIFLNEPVIEYLLHKNGFKILQKRYLKNIAYFLRVKKS